MALREALWSSRSLARRPGLPVCRQCRHSRRPASTAAALAEDPVDDVSPTSSLATPPLPQEQLSAFDPVEKARRRVKKLPRSRYQFRPPKYYRGPFHPHQPPPASDPSSRLFVPGPFTLPRLEQHYHSTIAPDILTMCYQHLPPGFRPPPKPQRLRSWDESSPYHQNRPLRGPRGGDVLRLLRKPIHFNNIPALERVTVHSYVKDAATHGSQHLHVAGMAVQAITNVRVQTFKARHSESQWGLIKGRTSVAVKAELEREDMYHFLSKLVDVVLPRVKDWRGIRGTTGDSSGNLSFGFGPEVVALFPEIEVNYDMYPPKMIPGCHITIHTTAATDKDARLLLQTLGIPFWGKHVD